MIGVRGLVQPLGVGAVVDGGDGEGALHFHLGEVSVRLGWPVKMCFGSHSSPVRPAGARRVRGKNFWGALKRLGGPRHYCTSTNVASLSTFALVPKFACRIGVRPAREAGLIPTTVRPALPCPLPSWI